MPELGWFGYWTLYILIVLSISKNFVEAIYRIYTENDVKRNWKSDAVASIIAGIIMTILFIIIFILKW